MGKASNGRERDRVDLYGRFQIFSISLALGIITILPDMCWMAQGGK